jgi:hypothetical protein
MNELMKRYWTPTPKKCRKIGDSLLAVSTVLAIGGLWQFDNLKNVFTPNELKFMIVLSRVVSLVGKFLSNFFVSLPKENNSFSLSVQHHCLFS